MGGENRDLLRRPALWSCRLSAGRRMPFSTAATYNAHSAASMLGNEARGSDCRWTRVGIALSRCCQTTSPNIKKCFLNGDGNDGCHESGSIFYTRSSRETTKMPAVLAVPWGVIRTAPSQTKPAARSAGRQRRWQGRSWRPRFPPVRARAMYRPRALLCQSTAPSAPDCVHQCT